MDDMERYGDYNDTGEDEAPRKFGFAFALKILGALICICVVGVLGFRVFLFSYYPASIRSAHFTDTLRAYEESGKEPGLLTQKLRFPYDDNDKGHFFAGYMTVAPGAGEIQFALRYNVSAIAQIAKESGVDGISSEDFSGFCFRLSDNYGRQYPSVRILSCESFALYRYARLAFDGIDFSSEQPPEWIRLDIYVAGGAETPYSSILIYEDNEENHIFADYVLSSKERNYD